MALTDKLIAIADAIRSKTNKTASLTLDEMPSEIMSISGGGSSDIPFEFGGMNAEFISEYNESWSLADTSFVIGESASTSATSIMSSISNRYTNTTGSPTVAYGDKDIVVVQTVNCEVEHEASATDSARQLKSSYVGLAWFSKRKGTDTSAKTDRQAVPMTANLVKYYNTKGVVTRALAGAYGFYGTPQGPSVSSATSTSAYVRVSSPTLNYRASSSYESTSNIKLVKDVHWYWNVKIYTVDPFTSPACAINDIQDAFMLG